MSNYRNLKLALEVISEGAEADVPQALGTESFLLESASIQRGARGWTNGRGIQGLGIAPKVVGGKTLKELALKVYVERKVPRAKCKFLVPKRVNVPDGPELTTDVEEIGRVAAEVFRERVRPAMPGSGLGHFDVTVGTFGALVKREGDRSSLYILSNSHVLAEGGLSVLGDPILQPGSLDGGRRPQDSIAKLASFVPFRFTSSGYPNLVDAAIAKVLQKSQVQAEVRILGVKPTCVSSYVRRGMQVQKVGRTTDYTVGEIRDVDYRLALSYQAVGGRRKRVGLKDLALCTRYTAGGDSGSAVLSSSKKMVGLHFAGSPSTSIFCRASHVMRLLKIKLA